MAIFKSLTRLTKRLIRKYKNRKRVQVVEQLDMPDGLTDAEIEANRDEIIRLLQSTRRKGIDNVIRYLDKYDFYAVPSSVNHHHNWRGGLAQHSLAVYRIAKSWMRGDVSEHSLIIACLLHDICKADQLLYDENGILYRTNMYVSGHGKRSVQILMEKCHLDLREDERLAIRWHMGGNNAHSHENAEVNRTRKDILWKFLSYADRQDAGRLE